MVDTCAQRQEEPPARATPAAKDPRISGAPTPWEITANPRISDTMSVGIMPLVLLEDDNLAMRGTKSLASTGASRRNAKMNTRTRYRGRNAYRPLNCEIVEHRKEDNTDHIVDDGGAQHDLRHASFMLVQVFQDPYGDADARGHDRPAHKE